MEKIDVIKDDDRQNSAQAAFPQTIHKTTEAESPKTIDDLTDGEVFRIVLRDAIRSIIYFGIGVIAILILKRFSPSISFDLAIVFVVICALNALLRVFSLIAGVVVAVFNLFGVKPSKPQQTGYVWASDAVRWTEMGIYAVYLFLLYEQFYK